MGGLFGGGGGSSYTAPSIPATPPSATPAVLANPQNAIAAATSKQRAAAASGAGYSGTLTNTGGAVGDVSTPTAQRSLLG